MYSHQTIQKIHKPTALHIALSVWLALALGFLNATLTAHADDSPVAPPVVPPPALLPQALQATTHYVSADNNCGGMTPCYTIIQTAVDAAVTGDTVKVAKGTYTSPTVQVIRIVKSLVVQGGFTASNWDVSNPDANITRLDGQSQVGRRGIVAEGTASAFISVTIAGFTVYQGINAPPQSCGGICTLYADVNIDNNRVLSNTASGIQIALSTGIVQRNLVQYTKTDTFEPYGNSGIIIETSVAMVKDNILRNNGNGIYVFKGSSASLVGNLVERNEQGIASERSITFSMEQNISQNNEGRGVYVKDATPFNNVTALSIFNNVITGNLGTGIEMRNAYNGQIFSNTIGGNRVGINSNPSEGSALTITQNLIQKNIKDGITLNPGSVLAPHWILSNTISHNGTSGVLVNDSEGSETQIIGNTIEFNVPESKFDTDDGGGINIQARSHVLIVNNRIAHNASNHYGGGIAIGTMTGDKPIVTMTANLILTNTSPGTGSAIAIGGGQVFATNDIIARNYSELQAVYIFGGKLVAEHWTIANNGSYGVKVFFGGSALISNTIIAGHKVSAFEQSLSGGTFVADHTLSFNNGETCANFSTCTNTVQGDPKFVSDALLNFHIKAGSAAIDQATDLGLAEDIDGPGRPQGAAPDIGADEFGNKNIIVYEVYVPVLAR